MNQTKLESIIERTADMTTGFIISALTYQYIVIPNESISQNAILVTSLFTLFSFFRGYVWRRFFNRGLHKIVHRYITTLLKR